MEISKIVKTVLKVTYSEEARKPASEEFDEPNLQIKWQSLVCRPVFHPNFVNCTHRRVSVRLERNGKKSSAHSELSFAFETQLSREKHERTFLGLGIFLLCAFWLKPLQTDWDSAARSTLSGVWICWIRYSPGIGKSAITPGGKFRVSARSGGISFCDL